MTVTITVLFGRSRGSRSTGSPLSPLSWHRLEQHPAALLVDAILLQPQGSRHLIVVHLVENVEVALLAAALRAAVDARRLWFTCNYPL